MIKSIAFALLCALAFIAAMNPVATDILALLTLITACVLGIWFHFHRPKERK